MDFNVRAESEQLFVDYPEISDPLQEFLQELDILFEIEKGTVLGQRNMGADLERMLWTTSFNASLIQHKVTEAIELYCQSRIEFDWNAEVQLMKGSTRDIGVISIYIKNKDGATLIEQTYVFK